MVEHQLPKLNTRVRFPVSALSPESGSDMAICPGIAFGRRRMSCVQLPWFTVVGGGSPSQRRRKFVVREGGLDSSEPDFGPEPQSG